MKPLTCPTVLIAFTVALQMLLLLFSVHIDLAASGIVPTGAKDGDDVVAILNHEKPFKKGKPTKTWHYVGGTGHAIKVFLQVLFSVTAIFSIWQQMVIAWKDTYRLFRGSEKKRGSEMLEQYLGQLKGKSKALERPKPDPTTEEPVFAFFRENFIAACIVFGIGNLALIMFMYRTSRERALAKQLEEHRMQDVIVVTGRTNKLQSKKKRKRRKSKKKDQ